MYMRTDVPACDFKHGRRKLLEPSNSIDKKKSQLDVSLHLVQDVFFDKFCVMLCENAPYPHPFWIFLNQAGVDLPWASGDTLDNTQTQHTHTHTHTETHKSSHTPANFRQSHHNRIRLWGSMYMYLNINLRKREKAVCTNIPSLYQKPLPSDIAMVAMYIPIYNRISTDSIWGPHFPSGIMFLNKAAVAGWWAEKGQRLLLGKKNWCVS